MLSAIVRARARGTIYGWASAGTRGVVIIITAIVTGIGVVAVVGSSPDGLVDLG